MGDFDDMNATPLAKLPMPAVQSKTDAPRVDGNTSYADLLKEMQQAPPPAAAPHHHHHHQPAAPQQPPAQAAAHVMSQQPMAAAQYALPTPYQHAQHMSQPPRYDDDDDEQPRRRRARRYAPPPRPDRTRRARGVGVASLVDRLREYKTAALMAAIVFVVLWYVAPKLAAAAPQLLTPTGKFKTTGLLLLAVASAGIHRVADHYVP
jgi:hypothetical protein